MRKMKLNDLLLHTVGGVRIYYVDGGRHHVLHEGDFSSVPPSIGGLGVLCLSGTGSLLDVRVAIPPAQTLQALQGLS